MSHREEDSGFPQDHDHHDDDDQEYYDEEEEYEEENEDDEDGTPDQNQNRNNANDNDDNNNNNRQQQQYLVDDVDNEGNEQVQQKVVLGSKDKVLYEEVLSYLMRGHKMAAGSDSAGPSHLPTSMQKAYSNRHVTVNPDPTDIIPGPVHFVDLPLGLALLFDVATDELFVERWQDRRLAEFPPPVERPAEASAVEGEAASAGDGNNNNNNTKGAAAGASVGSPSSKDGEKEGDKNGKSEGEKKEGDVEKKEEGGDDDNAEGENRSPSDGKKHKRVVEKPEWGGEKSKKAAPQKKYSTLIKSIPVSRAIEFTYTSDINAELQLMGAPEWIPYLCYICSLPAPRDDRCTQLYEYGVSLATELDKKFEEAKKAKAEEELKACTFHPVVSDAIKKLPGCKGDLVKFYSDKLDWVKQMNRKLQKKKEKQEKEREELNEQWKLGDKSKKILDRRERRLRKMGLEYGETPPRAADRRGVEITPEGAAAKQKQGGGGALASHTFRKTNTGPEFSFKPVTNSNRFRNMKSSNTSATADDGENQQQGDKNHYNFTSILDEFHLSDQYRMEGESEADFLARMDLDNQGRIERCKQRAIQFMRQQKEKLFDPVTGQPLFEPNAAPTVIRQDGARISYHDLSGKEQKDLIRKLKQQKRLDFIPGVARDKSDSHKLGDEEMADMYKRMLEKVRQGTKKIDRIRRKEDLERKTWFKPTIDGKTEKILKHSTKLRKPVYKLPLPRKPAPPPPKPQPKSSDILMLGVAERNETFLESKKKALETKVAEKKIKDTGLTFQPKVSKASTKMVERSRGSLQNEIAASDAERRAYYATRSAEIHYASEMAGGGFRQASPPQQSNINNNNNNNDQRNGSVSSPKQQQQEAYHVSRELGWQRPEARRVASKYYFENEKSLSQQRQQQQQQQQQLLMRKMNPANNRFLANQQQQAPAPPQQQLQSRYVDPQQFQQQQPINTNNNVGSGGVYHEIDDIVGNMLSDSSRRRGDNTNNASSSPYPQPNSNRPAYVPPQFKAASTSVEPNNNNNNNFNSGRSNQQQRDLSPSGRKLQGILASWEALERQTASIL